MAWTHYVDVPAGSNIRDGCSRTLSINVWVYGDGDEVRITVGGRLTAFVVVFVVDRYCDTPDEHRRAYLMRDRIITP